jgi:capsule synthesis protein PGA_cap
MAVVVIAALVGIGPAVTGVPAVVPVGLSVLPFGDAATPSATMPSGGSSAVGFATTPDGRGYWVAERDGTVEAAGDAVAYGSAAVVRPVVGMAATPDGHGYWLVASDGGVFSFGDARFFGSTGGMRLVQPVVGMAATPDGGGYWLVASDGGIFSFGDAKFFGSTGAMALNRPIVGMAATPDGGGYWLVASDGGIFSFGDARFFGSTGALRLVSPVVGMAGVPDGGGYWVVASDGGIFSFGSARFFGSPAGSLQPARAAIGLAASPDGQGYSVLTVPASIRVGFAGDVNGIGRIGATLAAGGNPLSGMEPLLAGDAANIVNLETAVGSGGTPMQKEYTFQSPPALLTALRAAGVTVVNLANNHSMDFGAGSLEETIADAHAAGLLTVGAGADAAQAYAPAIVDTPEGTVAFIGLSQVVPAGWAAGPSSAGVATAYDVASSVAAIRAARAEADHVVVMIHWGIQLDVCPTPADEQLAQTLLAAGADVIAGGHPHVLQGIVAGPGTVVDYSLGNFAFYADNPPDNLTGLLTVDLGPGGATGYAFDPARMDSSGSPRPLSGSDASSALAYVASLAPGAGTCS